MTTNNITYEGKTYTLLMDAYPAHHRDEDVFEALAICSSDTPDAEGWQPIYAIHWKILDDLPEEYRDDQSNLCDWDNPSEVYASGNEYNAAQNSIF